MSNTYGKHLTLTLFGESHGPAIGAILDGMPGGVTIDEEFIASVMEKRKAKGSISTPRKEADKVRFLSGVKNGHSEGSPVTIMIENTNVHSSDYSSLSFTPRPGHADYAAHIKYNGYEDASGGGHFSGRLTAPIVACGAIALSMLQEKGIYIGTHIQSLHGIQDASFDESHLLEQVQSLFEKEFPVIDDEQGKVMTLEIEKAKANLDSVGGILDTCVVGLPAGIGEPAFDSLESGLAHGLFSIPAVKGVEFGEGFNLANMYGSEANDAFRMKDGQVVTMTNHNGGINGGISNGMPIRFKTVVKPTPSIAKLQKSIDYVTKQDTDIEIKGRHDPSIIHRARIVVDCVTALTLVDYLMERYGREYFGKEIINGGKEK